MTSLLNEAKQKTSDFKTTCENYSSECKTQLENTKQDVTRQIETVKQSSDCLLREIDSQIEGCEKTAEAKLTEIKNEAEKYVASLSDIIARYENNFSMFNQKLVELKDAVTSLQR